MHLSTKLQVSFLLQKTNYQFFFKYKKLFSRFIESHNNGNCLFYYQSPLGELKQMDTCTIHEKFFRNILNIFN